MRISWVECRHIALRFPFSCSLSLSWQRHDDSTTEGLIFANSSSHFISSFSSGQQRLWSACFLFELQLRPFLICSYQSAICLVVQGCTFWDLIFFILSFAMLLAILRVLHGGKKYEICEEFRGLWWLTIYCFSSLLSKNMTRIGNEWNTSTFDYFTFCFLCPFLPFCCCCLAVL